MARVAITVILEGGASDRCAVRVSPLAELTACLHALGEADHHPASRSWLMSVRDGRSPKMLDAAAWWAPLWGSLRARFFYPLDADGERDLTEELAAIGRLPLRTFVSMCAEPLVDRDRSVPYDRLLDDRSCRDAFLEVARRLSADRLAVATRLLDTPAATREELLGFLRAFATETFEPEWRRVLPALRDDAAQRRRDLRQRGLHAIAGVTSTAQERREPHRVVFDKLYQAMARIGDDPCILVPSVHVGPHVVIKHARGLPIVIQYAAGATVEPSSADVHQRLQALTDPSRVQLCRAILRGRRSTVDLAQYTGMSEPQVSRHLRRLREAGLVRTTREGRLVYYEMDVEVLRCIGTDLLTALWR